MYYPVLIIPLALFTPILSRSSSFRKLREAHLIKRDVTRDCNYVAEDLQDAITSKELSTIQLDETGVYFLPAAAVRSIQTHFTDESFFISNPVNMVPKFRISRTKKEFTPKTDFLGETSEKVETYENKVAFIQNEDGNSKKTRKTPSYFDVDVEEAANSDRAAIEKNYLIKDFESTERALVECLDLQILDYTRKYGAVDEFKDFWVARNLKNYEGLLNVDLHDRLRKYCSQPEFIIERSLLDIKRGVPKKEKDMRAVKDKVDSNRSRHDANLHSISSSSDVESFSSWTEPTPIYDDTTEMATTINKSVEDMSVTTNDNDMSNETNDTNSTPIAVPMERNIHNSEDLGDIFISTKEAESGVTVITTESSFNLIDSETHLSAESQKYNTNEDEIDMDTMATEIILTTDDYNINNPISDEVTTIIAPKTQEELSLKINDEDDVSIYDISTTPVITVYPQSRNIYKENEIKIPKLTTRECENNTVQSTLDGNEVIPNNDFGYLDKSGDNNRGPGLEPLIESVTERDGKISDDDYISGNLYFDLSQELIPVRFQQTNSGKINLGVDGDSLCEKLLRKTNDKSLLLTTLCKCLQKKMLLNNSTKT